MKKNRTSRFVIHFSTVIMFYTIGTNFVFADSFKCSELLSPSFSLASIASPIPPHKVQDPDQKERLGIRISEKINNFIVRLNLFATFRNLNQYIEAFGQEFVEALQGLDSGGHWLDIGAGQARAQLQFLGSNLKKSPKMTAVGISIPSLFYASWTFLKSKRSDVSALFNYLSGRKIEDYEESEIEKADLITDLMGSFAYSKHADQTLKKLIQFLKPGGKLFVQPMYMSLKIVDSNDVEIPLHEWVNSFRGVRILEKNGEASFFSLLGGLKLEATGDSIEIPELEVINFIPGTPSFRTYRWRR